MTPEPVPQERQTAAAALLSSHRHHRNRECVNRRDLCDFCAYFICTYCLVSFYRGQLTTLGMLLPATMRKSKPFRPLNSYFVSSE